MIVRLRRRDLVWINVTANPQRGVGVGQITEAFPWDGAYMIRDRDNRYVKWHRPCLAPALVGEGVPSRETAAGEEAAVLRVARISLRFGHSHLAGDGV
jgi:hypothetical protein